jgi:hypothetical protein
MSTIQLTVEGFLKISDFSTKEVLVDKCNAIHFENFSLALANGVSNQGTGYIYEIHFGNGGTSIDPTGVITYLPPNTTGQNADLYNPTYSKVIDGTTSLNPNPSRNYMEVRHTPGNIYTDIFVSCLLDYGEPTGQAAFDSTESTNSTYVFDELGLKSFVPNQPGAGQLLTHVVFHPIQKSLNRLIQVDYTVRVSALTNLSNLGQLQ